MFFFWKCDILLLLLLDCVVMPWCTVIAVSVIWDGLSPQRVKKLRWWVFLKMIFSGNKISGGSQGNYLIKIIQNHHHFILYLYLFQETVDLTQIRLDFLKVIFSEGNEGNSFLFVEAIVFSGSLYLVWGMALIEITEQSIPCLSTRNH